MAVEERLRNKNLYKIELGLLKVLPMLIAGIYLLNTILSYFWIDLPILSSIGGLSFLPLVFIYISSYVFKFCEYNRIFLHYIVVNDLINIYDYYIGIPLDDLLLFCLHIIIAGISLFLILYMYLRSKKI